MTIFTWVYVGSGAIFTMSYTVYMTIGNVRIVYTYVWNIAVCIRHRVQFCTVFQSFICVLNGKFYPRGKWVAASFNSATISSTGSRRVGIRPIFAYIK